MTIKVQSEIDPAVLAKEMAHQCQDEAVLAFLGDLDEAMASWDFTQRAAELFVRTGLTLEEHDGNPAKASLARVAEFLRQAELQPHVKGEQPILTVWTDPQAESAALNAHDLAKLVELAMISLPAQAPA